MTELEARLCMKYGFPVKAYVFDVSTRFEAKGYIVDVNEFIEKEFRKFEYSATISTNGKAQYITKLVNIEVEPIFRDTLQKYIEQTQLARMKACIGYLLAAGWNKTRIVGRVGFLIDELRADKKKGKNNDRITAEGD